MTAINAYAVGARGRLLTDTAAYDESGVVAGFVNKAVTIPHLGAAFACRGALRARRIVTEEFELFSSFDDILRGGGTALKEAHDEGEFRSESESEFDVILVGLSQERSRAEAYTISSISHGGAEPFTFSRMDLIMAPLPSATNLRQLGILRGGAIIVERPAHALLAIMESQRETPGPTCSRDGAPLAYVVGGQAVLTEITSAGIAQRVVRRWPDIVGSPIIVGPASSPRPVLRLVG